MRRGSWEEANAQAVSAQDASQAADLRTPARYVHVDQTERGAWSVLADSLGEDEANRLSKSRWAIINVWRPIRKITRDPLAFADARTVPDSDLVPVMAELPDKSTGKYHSVKKIERFELFEGKWGEGHEWYYASDMEPDEVVLFKCFDSKNDGKTARRVPHTSFVDPKTRGLAEARQSIELRCLVFWEDDVEH